jgi:probable HAF family extracellular repeat protein
MSAQHGTGLATIAALALLSAGSISGCRDEGPTEPYSVVSHYLAPTATVFPMYTSTTGIPYIRTRIPGEGTRTGSLLDMNEVGWAVGSRIILVPERQLVAIAVNIRTGDTVRIGSSFAAASQAKAINARGEVVGGAPNVQPQDPTAFHWRDGELTPLGSGSAMDINATGVVVGYSWEGNTTYPWIWHGGATERLGTASGRANAVNNGGEIVGAAQLQAWGPTVPVSWKNGTPVPLITSWWGEATSLNERGQIVGSAIGLQGITEAFLWERDSVTWLGTLQPGAPSWATAINQRGEIAGNVSLPGEFHAVLWRSGQIIDLGLSGVVEPFENISEALGITNSGEVIGRVGQGGGRNGVVWLPPR